MGNIKFDFKDKHVLVTGGGQGIGRKITEDFLESEAKVTVWDISEKNLRELKKDFPQVETRKVDVSSLKECEEASKNITSPIDFLINNAGILRDRSLQKITPKEYEEVMGVCLNGPFFVTKSLLPHFKDSDQKRIINLSSVVALFGNFGQTNYVAAKSGVIGFTKVWAKELGKKSFTVNAIAPGFINTEILKDMPQEVLDSLIKKVPVGRLGEVQDISKACLYLCSKEASYINGAVLEVTGAVSF